MMLTVVGNTTVDVFVRGAQAAYEGDPIPATDPAVVNTSEPVVPALGGSGAGTAFVAAKLGDVVRLWSAVGSDSLGDMALGWLEGGNVDTTSVRITVDRGTSSNVVVAANGATRVTYYYPGASATFAPRVRQVWGGETDWLLITGYDSLPLWRGDYTLDLLRNARNNRVSTAFDFGGVSGDPVTAAELEPLLPHVRVLFCEGQDLEALGTGDLANAAGWALDHGVELVVARIGLKGAVLFEQTAREGTRMDGQPVAEVLHSAAADGFTAGFLHGLAQHQSPLDCARFGNAVAAIVGRSVRGVLDAPDEDAVRRFMSEKT